MFHYDASGNAIAVTYNGTEYYYVRNAQGDIIKLIDSTGATVVEYTYNSWGKLLSTTGSLATTLGSDQPFRYRDYVYDTETSLYYLQTRYYDPSTCRFLSADVVLSTGQGVLGHNAYAYCNNCPVPFCDSEGKSIELAFWMFFLWLIGDESDVYFDENSLMCRCLKESDYMNEIIDKSIGKYNVTDDYIYLEGICTERWERATDEELETNKLSYYSVCLETDEIFGPFDTYDEFVSFCNIDFEHCDLQWTEPTDYEPAY